MAREQADKNGTTTEIPVDIYLLKVNNRNNIEHVIADWDGVLRQLFMLDSWWVLVVSRFIKPGF